MHQAAFKDRTKQFALDVISLVESLPRSRAADVIGRQLLRSSTSVGANYRAACRARSKRDFISKMGIVEEEADESLFWLELLSAKNFLSDEQSAILIREINEILAMTVASIKTSRTQLANPQSEI